MGSFEFRTPPRIVARDGASEALGAALKGVGASRVLVTTDPFLASSGLLDPALESVRQAGLGLVLFDEVQTDPPEAVVLAATARARSEGVDAVVGLGGGSALDTAKLAALLAVSDQRLEDIYGLDLARGPRLTLVQIPTTAGTGSEATPISIVTRPDGRKTGVISDWLYPDLAILDATLTLGLLPRATAMTGVDAMVHAVEAYTSRLKKNPVSDALAIKALSLLAGNIRRVVEDGSDLSARRAMLEGSLLAGMAFANAPVAAVHALAYPLGGRFHVPHGLSNALVFAQVADFNLSAAADQYGELARLLPDDLTVGRYDGDAFVQGIGTLVREMPMEQRLGQVGVSAADLDALADEALGITRLLVNNPREVTLADARRIYASAL